MRISMRLTPWQCCRGQVAPHPVGNDQGPVTLFMSYCGIVTLEDILASSPTSE